MRKNKEKISIETLSVLALLVSILVGNEILSTVLVFTCAFISIGILYHKLPELSNISEENPKVKVLRFITVFNGLLIAGLMAFAILAKNEIISLSEKQFAFLLPILFALIMIVFGNVAPKIPHNRYTGLRLPWTVNDEEAWILAHRILGYISIPCGILCFAGAGNPRASLYIPVAMLFVWILIPALLSYIFFYRKWHLQK